MHAHARLVKVRKSRSATMAANKAALVRDMGMHTYNDCTYLSTRFYLLGNTHFFRGDGLSCADCAACRQR